MTRRADIALRVLAAVAGGYALAAGTAAALTLALSTVQEPADAVLTATMAALLPCVLTVLAVFAAASARRALLWTAALSGALWSLTAVLATLLGAIPGGGP